MPLEPASGGGRTSEQVAVPAVLVWPMYWKDVCAVLAAQFVLAKGLTEYAPLASVMVKDVCEP